MGEPRKREVGITAGHETRGRLSECHIIFSCSSRKQKCSPAAALSLLRLYIPPENPWHFPGTCSSPPTSSAQELHVGYSAWGSEGIVLAGRCRVDKVVV